MNQEHDWYTNDLWRGSFLEEAVRSLSKLGTLEPHEAIFCELSDVLPKPEVVQLYLLLRDSRRFENEWRDEFLGLFPGVQDHDLPAMVNVYHTEPGQVSGQPPARPPLDIQSDDDIPF